MVSRVSQAIDRPLSVHSQMKCSKHGNGGLYNIASRLNDETKSQDSVHVQVQRSRAEAITFPGGAKQEVFGILRL